MDAAKAFDYLFTFVHFIHVLIVNHTAILTLVSAERSPATLAN